MKGIGASLFLVLLGIGTAVCGFPADAAQASEKPSGNQTAAKTAVMTPTSPLQIDSGTLRGLVV